MRPTDYAVRFSNLKNMARSPAHYLDALANSHDTRSMRKGRATHSYLLGSPSDVAVFSGRRAGKAWEEFEAAHADKTILNPSEFEEVDGMRRALHANSAACRILFDDTIRERQIEWTRLGRKCSGTPDVVGVEHVAELKTARTSHPERFNSHGRWYQYHAQLAWYRSGLVESGLGNPSRAYVVAVESSRPYPVTVFELTERALDQGDRACRLWLERLLACEAFDSWPGYVETIVPFDIPDADDFVLSIGGEEMSV